MKTNNLTIYLASTKAHYEISIGADLLKKSGNFAREKFGTETRKIIIVSNAKVFCLYGQIVKESLEKEGFAVAVWLMNDGEKYKNLRSLENALEFFSTQKLTRSDGIIALGGGVVGDLTGFAAAIFQRGVPFIQIPTTFLAMIDSSVGGKTAVNSAFGKNLIGAFYQPHGVLIDIETLKTLPRRELTAGFAEAVKHGAISGEILFAQTHNFLKIFPVKNFAKFFDSEKPDEFRIALQNLISAQVAFKAEIISGDERENITRNDAKSRKILNFGHTVGHALEKVTHYKRFKHGEAVAYGILIAAEISKKLAKLSKTELNLISDSIRLIGKLPLAFDLATNEIIEAFAHDKKTSGDSLKWILLEKIGSACVVENREISPEIIRQAIREVLMK